MMYSQVADKSAMKLLLYEIDAVSARTLRVNLILRGYDVQWTTHDDDALSYIRSARPNVAVVSSDAPGYAGLALVRRARESGLHLPMLLLASTDDVQERVRSLEAGADDSMQKPAHIDELAARLRVLLRRCGQYSAQEGRLNCGPLSVDANGGIFHVRRGAVRFSPRERALLSALIRQSWHAVGKDELFSKVFGDERDVQRKSLDVLVYRVRKKLSGSGVSIITFGSAGYALQAD